MLDLVPDGAPLRVLDVGCGPGWVAAELRRRGHHVTGVDLIADEGVTERTDRFFEANLEHGLPDAVGGGFDVVIAADVIEHVRDPDELLADLAGRTSRTGMIIASVPNFGHWYPRARTAAGLFDYDQRGILDRDPRAVLHPPELPAGGGATPAWSPPPSGTPGCRSTCSGWRAPPAGSSPSSIACCATCGRRCSPTSSS